MPLLRRKKSNTKQKPPVAEIQWHPITERPREGARIQIIWLDEIFNGTFNKATDPWGLAWSITPSWFGTRWIATNQISRWRYRD